MDSQNQAVKKTYWVPLRHGIQSQGYCREFEILRVSRGRALVQFTLLPGVTAKAVHVETLTPRRLRR